MINLGTTYCLVTVEYEPKYSSLIGMIFGFVYVSGGALGRDAVADKELVDPNWGKNHPKEWASITGVYCGESGKSIFKIRRRDIDTVRMNIKELKSLNLISDYAIESL